MPAHTTHDAARDEAVAPLLRGIAVLGRLTGADGGTLSLSALERTTGLARSTVDRLTATLARMGYVRLDGRDVALAPRLMELGNAYLAALRLPALLSARADGLADELDESVSLAVGDRDGIRFIHQATRRRAMSLSFRIGDLLPAERTAPGPLFAAEWTASDWHRWRERRAADPGDHSFPAVPPREPGAPGEDFARRAAKAAADGWALDDQLIEPGLVAVSVPVRDPGTGRVACVASVVSHTSRHTAPDLRAALLPRLRAAVAAMEDDLRAAPAPEPGPPPAGLALWTGASKQELGREFVESLARGLTVLTAFGEGRSALTLTQVAQATGLARATARRALLTHARAGLVAPAAGHTFTLTPRVLSLGFPPLSRTSLPEIAQPHLTALAERVHESASLAVLSDSGEEIQYTARASAARVLSARVTVGTRLPARATALGRVLLALPEVRARGYALVDEELEAGLRAIAVPVRDRTGRVVAALNVALHAARRTADDCVAQILPELRHTADLVETELRVAGRFCRVAVV
ncbi:IclR family transcriptional regulator domain-containing protein [Streptomyces lividans]|uniref:Transcriptional regulator n=1 Tax=Streptomyces lividans TK24 TaxID=457428 RepID=A0ABM5R4R0_STRLI|nr:MULTISPECIES: IclR family transcriptional regulator C-terminal domain-containing protein [Streptomyces]QSJ10832.1 transcriptional regulator [Streptomyces lividans]AIJ15265.1 transcriptional regulator [Streptomyces lividans TK24]KKD11756.1 IclR family transcriptional regulator [Streptomyces sp. WM6391]QTD71742.1 transcriptional regulator [Streptomyces lividans TK24] [Streptomyces lividans]REH21584.1 IclR family transcriptional regulator [Streptomyces sp. 2221.1]